MKTISLTGVAALFLFVMSAGFYGTAYAEAVQGRVVAVDSAGNTVTVQPTQGRTTGIGQEGTVQFSLGQNSQLSGVSTLDELQVGDEIRVEGTQTAGTWEATSLERQPGVSDIQSEAGQAGFEQSGADQTANSRFEQGASGVEQSGIQPLGESTGMGTTPTNTTGAQSSDFGMADESGTIAGETATDAGEPVATGTPGVVDQNI